MLDEWLGDLRSVRHVKRTTIRFYQDVVRSFCQYVTDPAYDWTEQCEAPFGSHPIQVVHDWNTVVYTQENEADAAKRAFTLRELHTFFTATTRWTAFAASAARAGCRRSATRPLFKTAYAYGLRRNETRMLDATDFGRNPAERSSASTASATSGTAKLQQLANQETCTT